MPEGGRVGLAAVPGRREPARRLRREGSPIRFLRNTAGVECGFISLTYDKIGIFADDENMSRGVRDKVHRNFKEANMVVKEGSRQTCAELFIDGTEP